jgi:sodium transport system permease protein
MNSWKRIYNVFIKEATDNLRDRRSVISALMTTLIGPLMLLVLIFLIGRTINQDYSENPLKLHLSGAEQAPGLVEFLEQNGSTLPAPADPEE